MIYNIKKYLLEEGVMDAVKNNYGKGLLAAGALAGASGGFFGPDAQLAVSAGGDSLSKFAANIKDNANDTMKNLQEKYGSKADEHKSQDQSDKPDLSEQSDENGSFSSDQLNTFFSED